MNGYFLAIDAGGTKTDYLLADSWQILARVRTGSIKLLSVSAEVAASHLKAGLEQLQQRSGIDLQNVRCTCIGTSGAAVPLVTDWIRSRMEGIVGGALILCGDEEIALDAAFEGGRGILALAGTGSNVVGRTGDGHMVCAGGWGPMLADEGSGYWIGHQALRSAFRALDEGRTTLLLDAAKQVWGLDSLEALVERGNAKPAPDFSRLAEAASMCAEKGDAVALEVLHHAGRELARLVSLVLGRMKVIDPEASSSDVALAGSILRHVAVVRKTMTAELQQEYPQVTVSQRAIDPVQGALWRARTGYSGISQTSAT